MAQYAKVLVAKPAFNSQDPCDRRIELTPIKYPLASTCAMCRGLNGTSLTVWGI